MEGGTFAHQKYRETLGSQDNYISSESGGRVNFGGLAGVAAAAHIVTVTIICD